MNKLLALLLLLAVATAHGRSLLEDDSDCGDDNKCGRRVHPKYKVVGHEGATEIRMYEKATWVASFSRSRFGLDVASVFAAKGVIGYFAGCNQEHKKIRPSTPLATTLLRKPHPHPHPHPPPKNGSHPEPPHPPKPPKNGSHPHPPHPHPHPPPPPPGPPAVVVAAYINASKADAPKPDSPHVKLVSFNSTKIYSHKFGGFAISWFVKKEIRHLKKDLKALGLKPGKGKFVLATYNGPWKVFGRKNEIWWTERPKHNKTKDFEPEDMPVVTGFDQFDPMYLFPEEFLPPPFPEGEDLPEEVAEMEMEETEILEPGMLISETDRDEQNETAKSF